MLLPPCPHRAAMPITTIRPRRRVHATVRVVCFSYCGYTTHLHRHIHATVRVVYFSHCWYTTRLHRHIHATVRVVCFSHCWYTTRLHRRVHAAVFHSLPTHHHPYLVIALSPSYPTFLFVSSLRSGSATEAISYCIHYLLTNSLKSSDNRNCKSSCVPPKNVRTKISLFVYLARHIVVNSSMFYCTLS